MTGARGAHPLLPPPRRRRRRRGRGVLHCLVAASAVGIDPGYGASRLVFSRRRINWKFAIPETGPLHYPTHFGANSAWAVPKAELHFQHANRRAGLGAHSRGQAGTATPVGPERRRGGGCELRAPATRWTRLNVERRANWLRPPVTSCRRNHFFFFWFLFFVYTVAIWRASRSFQLSKQDALKTVPSVEVWWKWL